MKNTEEIKKKIVDAYRRGVCDSEGVTLPKEKQGRSGKGSHFRPARTQQYRDNFDKIVWSK